VTFLFYSVLIFLTLAFCALIGWHTYLMCACAWDDYKRAEQVRWEMWSKLIVKARRG